MRKEVMAEPVDELVKKALESIKNSKEMTEEEEIEYDAEFGYSQDDD